MKPRLLCAACRGVFASDVDPSGPVTCPVCGHRGVPAGVMQPTGVPSLEVFERNYLRARQAQQDEATSESSEPG